MAEARKSIESFKLLRTSHGRLHLDPEPQEGEQYIRLADVKPLVEAARVCELCEDPTCDERDELLEAIEAHRAEKAHGPTANMEHADGLLYTLADCMRGEGKP